MILIAHAHVAEWRAAQARERALARLSATGLIGYKPMGRNDWQRRKRSMLKARAAYREAVDEYNAASRRHTFWYRAYLRVRGGPFIVWSAR